MILCNVNLHIHLKDERKDYDVYLLLIEAVWFVVMNLYLCEIALFVGIFWNISNRKLTFWYLVTAVWMSAGYIEAEVRYTSVLLYYAVHILYKSMQVFFHNITKVCNWQSLHDSEIDWMFDFDVNKNMDWSLLCVCGLFMTIRISLRLSPGNRLSIFPFLYFQTHD